MIDTQTIERLSPAPCHVPMGPDIIKKMYNSQRCKTKTFFLNFTTNIKKIVLHVQKVSAVAWFAS